MTQISIPQTVITFPEIALRVRDGHKLRGYFGNVFKEHSDLLHNHFADGSPQYRYSLVQYKVLDNVPTLVGIGEAAQLLIELFLRMKVLIIDGHSYPILSKNISHQNQLIGLTEDLYTYRFQTLWLGLNQKNYVRYDQMQTEPERVELLKKTAVANVLTFFEATGLDLPKSQRILMKLNLKEPILTNFKDVKLMAFGGTFTTNALLPNCIGLGKSISRGFGSIVQM